MKNSGHKATAALSDAYEKFLLGTPLDKLDLSNVQYEAITLFEKYAADGATACQISFASGGAITGTTAAILRKVKKNFRTKVKIVHAGHVYRATRKIIAARPAYAKFAVRNAEPHSKLKLSEVLSLRLEGAGLREIKESGGSGYQFSKIGKIRALFERGNLDVSEISRVSDVTVTDVRKCLKIYKNWKGKNKIDEMI